jgi:hypothetical protein
VYFTHAVNFPRVEENALGGGGFPSINMSDNTYISGFFQWKFSRHMYCYSSRSDRVLIKHLPHYSAVRTGKRLYQR